jgi:hypothetical protein
VVWEVIWEEECKVWEEECKVWEEVWEAVMEEAIMEEAVMEEAVMEEAAMEEAAAVENAADGIDGVDASTDAIAALGMNKKSDGSISFKQNTFD